jgi:hypothetical protein
MASLYLFWHTSISVGTAEERLSRGLRSLLEFIGPQGRIAVLVAVAYLAGTMLVGAMNTATRSINLALLKAVTDVNFFAPGRPLSILHLVSPYSRPSLRRLQRLCDGDSALLRSVCADILSARGERLLINNKDLYGEYDRFRSEAEFRNAISIPLIVLAAAWLLNTNWSGWADLFVLGGALIVAVILTFQALNIARGAHSMYAHAVADGVVSTASLDALRPAVGSMRPMARSRPGRPHMLQPRRLTRRAGAAVTGTATSAGGRARTSR